MTTTLERARAFLDAKQRDFYGTHRQLEGHPIYRWMVEFAELNRDCERCGELEKAALSFELQAENEELGLRQITLDRRRQRDGSVKWTVRDRAYVLGRDGEWHYESISSNRTGAFLALTRFSSIAEGQAAYQAARSLINKGDE